MSHWFESNAAYTVELTDSTVIQKPKSIYPQTKATLHLFHHFGLNFLQLVVEPALLTIGSEKAYSGENANRSMANS